MSIAKPKKLQFESQNLKSDYAKFSLDPLEPGFGMTIGHSLRRVLLSSIRGSAVFAVQIDGVTHEFSNIPGIVEDMVQVILNIKELQVEQFVDEVVELEDFLTFEVAGMQITSIFAPGHTKGSVIFTVDDQQLISGDVLFAGSIGRTDLPTGSANEMRKTLRDRILTLPDGLNVLPGHGGQTTIGTERVRNPYLQDDFLDQNGR